MTAFDDERLGNQLSERLHDEMSDMSAPQDLASTLRRRHARRNLGVRVAGGATVVAAVAVAGSLALGTTGQAPSVGGTAAGSGSSAQMVDVSYVSSKVVAALGNTSDYVLKSHAVWSDGLNEIALIDNATQRERHDTLTASGAVGNSTLVTGTGPNNMLVVDNIHRAWYYDNWGGLPQVSPGSDTSNIIVGEIYDPATIKKAQDEGKLKLVGQEGDTLHLRWAPFDGFTEDFWVDATSFLPTKVTSAGTKGSGTTEFTWLPRSAENLAGLNLTVPAGYTKTAPEDPRHS